MFCRYPNFFHCQLGHFNWKFHNWCYDTAHTTLTYAMIWYRAFIMSMAISVRQNGANRDMNKAPGEVYRTVLSHDRLLIQGLRCPSETPIFWTIWKNMFWLNPMWALFIKSLPCTSILLFCDYKDCTFRSWIRHQTGKSFRTRPYATEALNCTPRITASKQTVGIAATVAELLLHTNKTNIVLLSSRHTSCAYSFTLIF